jgi:Holliday junction DNA helicase RuvB
MYTLNVNKIRICPNCQKQFEDKYPHYKVRGTSVCSEVCWNQYDPKNSPTEIIIKPEALDLSQVKEGEGGSLYRPQSFVEYVGQTQAKDRVQDYIQGCQKFNEIFPHTFLSAPSGCGKTTFALILANMLNKKFVSLTAQEIRSEQQMVNKIIECEGGIIFLDEAHRISTKVGTFLLPILEDFKIQDKKIKPFTMFMASTHKGNISKNLDALMQRFLPINLVHYEIPELITIIKNYHKQKYVSVSVPESVFSEIANNCRRTPRIALALLKEYVFTLDWKRVLKNNHIIENGLTENDFRVLRYIDRNGGAGKASLAKYLRVEPNTYEYEIEPYLMFLELLTVDNKRKLTDKGKELI